jgi:phenylalanyl-tRNA synthetase, beta subunit
MPVINFKYGDLCSLLGQNVPQEVLVDRIPLIGADMHDTEGGNDDMSVEFFPDRPDLFSVEGLARGLRAFLDITPGMKEYRSVEGGIRVKVDDSVMSVRPCFSCAVIRNVNVTDDLIRSMMELQEKLHLTIGRKRSKLAIGIHDLDKVAPPFVYKAVSPKEVRFVPLTCTEEMDLDQILSSHAKGIEYADLLKGKKKYPIILDKNNNVLSFPPIINGALTTVTTDSRNLFVDVTGTDQKAVKGALDIVVTSLAERGGTIETVGLEGSLAFRSPDLSPRKMSISVKRAEEFIGIELGSKGVTDALKKMGMDAASVSKDTVDVLIPVTRLDIMHEVDIMEDIAVGYGFEHFGGSYSSVQTAGSLSPDSLFSEKVRDIMIGLGFNEVTTLTLSNENDEFTISGLPEKVSTQILNPITEDHTCLRSYLMPSLMRILRHNKHRDLPQKIFEIGYVSSEHCSIPHLCALFTASKVSFTEIKSVAESIVRELAVKYELLPCSYRTFIEGRGAKIIVKGKEVGIFGEVSPKVVTDFEITHPVIMFEMDLSSIISGKEGRLF